MKLFIATISALVLFICFGSTLSLASEREHNRESKLEESEEEHSSDNNIVEKKSKEERNKHDKKHDEEHEEKRDIDKDIDTSKETTPKHETKSDTASKNNHVIYESDLTSIENDPILLIKNEENKARHKEKMRNNKRNRRHTQEMHVDVINKDTDKEEYNIVEKNNILEETHELMNAGGVTVGVLDAEHSDNVTAKEDYRRNDKLQRSDRREEINHIKEKPTIFYEKKEIKKQESLVQRNISQNVISQSAVVIANTGNNVVDGAATQGEGINTGDVNTEVNFVTDFSRDTIYITVADSEKTVEYRYIREIPYIYNYYYQSNPIVYRDLRPQLKPAAYYRPAIRNSAIQAKQACPDYCSRPENINADIPLKTSSAGNFGMGDILLASGVGILSLPHPLRRIKWFSNYINS